tara:strand:- start:356 stop:460 length:105 start_codon:yes stop_codon:yes gene_type:complete
MGNVADAIRIKINPLILGLNFSQKELNLFNKVIY